MSEIKCSVDSCVYWGRGNVCQADEIMVKDNRANNYEMEIGEIAGESAAETSTETMCETFKPKMKNRS